MTFRVGVRVRARAGVRVRVRVGVRVRVKGPNSILNPEP